MKKSAHAKREEPERRPQPADSLSYDVLDALPIGTCLLDHSGSVVWLNREAARLLGRPPALCVRKPLGHLLGWDRNPSESVTAFPSIRALLATGQPALGDREVVAHPQGRRMTVAWTCRPLDPATGLAGVFSFHDLSDEIELQEDRDRLALIAEESPSPLVELNVDANLLYANPAMTLLLEKFGYTTEGFPRVLPANLQPLVQQCLATGRKVAHIEVAVSDACYAWTFCPASAHQTVRGYATELTDIRATQRQLRDTADHLERVNGELDKALQQAQEAVRVKTNFFATMSHELRTPMNGVIGMTSLLLETPISDEQRSYVNTIQQCGEALLSIINDVLDCSKIEAGRLELESIDFNLRTTVEDVLGQFAERAEKKGIEVTGLVHASVPTGLRGDPGRLRQVLTNLVANAVKFTDKGNVTVQAYLVDETPDSALVRFEVTDTGIGIAPEVQERLFTPFTQADSSTTRKYGGTGLGLSICRQLVELMGGEIGIHSRLGQGSTFWYTARLKKQASAPSPPVTPAELAGRRVLIVDDNESNRTILHHLVGMWGMQDDHAEDADQALQMVDKASASRQPYDLAILDMMMPGKNGLDLAKSLKSHPTGQRIKLVILTSLVQRGQAEQARQAGITAYLTKPVRHDQLYECLRTVLGLVPAVAADRSGAGADQTEAPPFITRHTLAENQRRLRVLVAEDNVINQKLTVRLLELLGYQVDVVANGQEAIEALERTPYAVVMMDCQMPVMDGFEATRRIRERERSRVQSHQVESPKSEDLTTLGLSDFRRIPIIALTANAMQGDRDRCLTAGMDDYLSKPVKKDELSATLQRWFPTAQPAHGRSDNSRPTDFPGVTTSSFDPAMILQNIGGDEEILQQLLAMFVTRSPGMLQQISDAIEACDARGLEHSAHAMKGTAGNLCAATVASIAGQLEALGRMGQVVEAAGVMEQLQQAVSRVVQDIRQLQTYRKSVLA